MQIKDNFDSIADEVAKRFTDDDNLKAVVEALQTSVMFSVYNELLQM